MAALRPHFTQLLYTATCYSLFDKDKMPFALTMALRLMRHSGSISEGEVNFLVNGRVNDQQDNIPGSTSHLRPQDPGDETDRQEL